MDAVQPGFRGSSGARSYPRRDLLRAAGGAGLLMAISPASGRLRMAALAQEATPLATPMASPVGGQAARFAYVGCYTRNAPGGGGTAPAVGISVFAVDANSGVLTLVETIPSDNPSFLALDPTQQFLYAVNEVDDFEGRPTGSVEAYAIDDTTGQLTLLNRQDCGGAIPAHLAVDPTGTHLVIGNYIGANYVVLPIAANGQLDPISDTVEQTGSGPNAERQEAPHPHVVVFDAGGRHVVTADLGIDKVQAFRLDTDAGTLELTSEVSTAAGAGPRHVAFHPNGSYLYVINELNATITAYAYDSAVGEIGDEIQTVSTVPDDFTGTKSTAEIVVHPAGDFLYGSNRGQPDATSPVADSIATFTIDSATGRLSLVGHTTDGMDTPRNFALDPTATWLYACNQQADTIVQFAVDPGSGELAATGEVTTSPTPVCIVFRT